MFLRNFNLSGFALCKIRFLEIFFNNTLWWLDIYGRHLKTLARSALSGRRNRRHVPRISISKSIHNYLQIPQQIVCYARRHNCRLLGQDYKIVLLATGSASSVSLQT